MAGHVQAGTDTSIKVLQIVRIKPYPSFKFKKNSLCMKDENSHCSKTSYFGALNIISQGGDFY
jgi:hypothetical protein